MEDLLSTPVARVGPTSRLLKRQSLVQPPNLATSLRLLDDALGSPIHHTEDITRIVDMTRNDTRFATRGDFTMMGEDVTRPLGPDQTALLGEENPGVKGTEILFDDFLTTSSSSVSGAAALDSVAEFEQMVTDHHHHPHPRYNLIIYLQVDDHVESLKKLLSKVDRAMERFHKTLSVLEGLTNERNTWRLMGKLYNDRLVTAMKDSSVLLPPIKNSERQIVEKLFQANSDIRQTWIVVEWLERNAKSQEEEVLSNQMQLFSEGGVAWENTLSAIQRGTAGANMVTELDPDGPGRTGKQLHSLDQEEETRLIKTVFGCVRCGLLEDGQDLCIRVGQAWRAATLEGWKLYHDPNYQSGTGGQGDKLPVEGNKHRDVWKAVAWRMTEDSKLPQHERAVYAALCGNLAQLVPVCTSWEDLLWAGAKCAVDVMVETEIREKFLSKQFEPLPTQYWNTPVSLSKVFAEIAGRGGHIVREANNPYHLIQKFLILDDWPGLVSLMAGWVRQPIDPHLLRLLAHLVLAHRALGVNGDSGSEEEILTLFTKYLMSQDKLGLVPWYVSRLPQDQHCPLLAEFLAGISSSPDQQQFLYLGREAGLQMEKIVVAAVEAARNTDRMISSLQWLSHDPDSQAGDLLSQTNSVVRRLLLQGGQVEAARQATDHVPQSVLEMAARDWRGDGAELPAEAVREHLALQAYLTAIETFNDWFDHYHRGQPVRPVMAPTPSFTERVAHEQRDKQFLQELERWRSGQLSQSRQTEEKLRAVLTFPGGWLLLEEREDEDTMDMRDGGEQERMLELSELRKQLVPRTVTLLHTLLHTTGQFSKSIAMADLVASDQHFLYSSFSQQDMTELLNKMRESSLAAMDQGKDPWGFNKL